MARLAPDDFARYQREAGGWGRYTVDFSTRPLWLVREVARRAIREARIAGPVS